MKLLKFFSQTCGPCKVMSPVVKDVMENNFPDIEVVDMDLGVGDSSVKARALGLRMVPSFVLIDEDGKAVGIKSGTMTAEVFKDFIDSSVSVS